MTNTETVARAPAGTAAAQARIKRIEPIAVSLPMTKPMKMAGVLIAAADNVLVRLELDSGQVGWGEAASAHSMTGETVESMMAAIRHMGPTLLQMDGADIAAVSGRMDQLMYYNQSAKSVVEMALHDALGRATGKPVFELLGGKRRSRVPVLWLLGTGSTEGDVAEALAKRAAGFVAFKVKVGVGDPLDDAARTRRVCEALGPGLLISADANQGYSVEQALAYVNAVEGAGLDFFEQPIAGHDIDGMANAMIDLSRDEPGRARMGAAGRALCLPRFDHRRMVEHLDALYREASTLPA